MSFLDFDLVRFISQGTTDRVWKLMSNSTKIGWDICFVIQTKNFQVPSETVILIILLHIMGKKIK